MTNQVRTLSEVTLKDIKAQLDKIEKEMKNQDKSGRKANVNSIKIAFFSIGLTLLLVSVSIFIDLSTPESKILLAIGYLAEGILVTLISMWVINEKLVYRGEDKN